MWLQHAVNICNMLGKATSAYLRRYTINKQGSMFFSLKKSGDFHCGEQGPRLHWAKHFEDQGTEGQNSSHDLDLDFSLDGGL